MTELSDKEKAYDALKELARGTALTELDRIKLLDKVHYYIWQLEFELRILG